MLPANYDLKTLPARKDIEASVAMRQPVAA